MVCSTQMFKQEQTVHYSFSCLVIFLFLMAKAFLTGIYYNDLLIQEQTGKVPISKCYPISKPCFMSVSLFSQVLIAK